ncbi:MAG TPA: FAD-dependent monooxygenase [Paracoccaceae bacterium]|nr:FAD-dependent monooxygenase [Paracoccaceae bacterium]
MKALIAGGGIAGMAAALWLARSGWSVDVFEQAEELTEVGAGLQLSPNVCRLLDRIGLLPALREHASRPHFAELRSGRSGRLVHRTELGAAAEARWGAPYLHVHRADLLDTLVEAAMAAGARLNLGQKVVDAASDADRAVLHLADGEVAEGDVLIGADGIRSRLRNIVGGGGPPRYGGQLAWRGLIPAESVRPNAVPVGATVWMGAGRHLVAYAVRGGALINFIAVVDRHGWAEDGWRQQGDPNALRAAFDGWADPVPHFLDAVTDCYLWGLFERPDQPGWVNGRIALVGDAAHPMKPFLAQGAGMAIEDAAALEHYLTGASDIPRALQKWELVRRPRVSRVAAQSDANGRLFHMGDGIARTMTHGGLGLFSRAAPRLITAQLDWLYGHDVHAGA